MAYAAPDSDIESVAASWAVRLDKGPLNDQEARELDAWLDADSRRVGALARAQAVWCDLDRIAAFDRGLPMAEPRRPRLHWDGWKAAASIAIAVFAAGSFGAVGYDQLAGRETSRRGEVRRLVLDDGSTVVLNTSSTVQIRFHKNRRDIYLRKGEASFQVAHDKARPFVVHARGVSVKAVGTAFAVHELDKGVVVTVAEGVVEVAREVGPTSRPVEHRYLSRNLQLVAARSSLSKPRAVSEAEVSRQLAWREGLLVFEGERLADAAAQVNRYSAKPVVIDDKALASRVVVGVFRIGDVQSFSRAAAEAFGAKVSEEDGALHLTAAGQS
jgi:transmembrane sensor